jgi:hypothetical protein
MRRTLGTAVFAGMLGVTLFGIFLTPVFYYVIQRFSDWRAERRARRLRDEEEEEPTPRHAPSRNGEAANAGIRTEPLH